MSEYRVGGRFEYGFEFVVEADSWDNAHAQAQDAVLADVKAGNGFVTFEYVEEEPRRSS